MITGSVYEDLKSLFDRLQQNEELEKQILEAWNRNDTQQSLEIAYRLRKELLNQVHEHQNRLSDLDFMIMQMQKEEQAC